MYYAKYYPNISPIIYRHLGDFIVFFPDKIDQNLPIKYSPQLELIENNFKEKRKVNFLDCHIDFNKQNITCNLYDKRN